MAAAHHLHGEEEGNEHTEGEKDKDNMHTRERERERDRRGGRISGGTKIQIQNIWKEAQGERERERCPREEKRGRGGNTREKKREREKAWMLMCLCYDKQTEIQQRVDIILINRTNMDCKYQA